MELSDEDLTDIHKGNRTKFSYRLAWARTYLKWYGLLENSSREVWSLTPDGFKTSTVDKIKVNEKAKGLFVRKVRDTEVGSEDKEIETEISTETNWQEELLAILQSIPPDRFERLCQRMLRELGFINVQVTGKSGDGGIDGKGMLRLAGVLSFPVVFQCKRYKGSVPPNLVRDFRGSMIGRADKGLLFTTGTFTRDAIREAQREGAPPIDLIDGYQFADTLRKLELGIEVHNVEKIDIIKNWFNNI
ncbi:restriction endonuclease [Chloroflexota bacterium]